MNKPCFALCLSLAVLATTASVLTQEFQSSLPNWQAGINRQLTERIDARMQQEMLARVENDYRNLYAEATEADDFEMNDLQLARQMPH